MRLAVLFMAFGSALSCLGVKELVLCRGTTAQPVFVELAELEAGSGLLSNYVRIGPHIAVLPAAVYRYRCAPGSAERLDRSSAAASHWGAGDGQLVACYYPIISRSHPFIVRLEQFAQRRAVLPGGVGADSLPKLEQFAVLVKTSRYRRAEEIPQGVQPSPGLCGLVVNRVESLGREERRFLQAGFPAVDFDRLWIVEEGRRPSSPARCIAMLGSGAVLVLAGARLFWRRAVSPL